MNIRFHCSIAFLLVTGGLSISLSRATETRQELGIQAGGLFFEGDSAVNEDFVGGFRIGHYISNNLEVSGCVVGGETESELTDDTANLLMPWLDIEYEFGQSNLRPYVAAGAGLLDINWSGTSDDNLDIIVPWGAGLKWFFHPSFVARLDARHIIDLDSGTGTHDALVSAGVSWLMGPTGTPTEEPSTPTIIDADKDGVPDKIDLCPDTPARVSVEDSGCPADSDQDGVPDYKDKCPNTIKGTFVNELGCVKDTDADGVPDDEDKCPQTPKNTPVDHTGCPEAANAAPQAPPEQAIAKPAGPEKDWILEGIQFEKLSDKLTSNSKSILDEAIAILKANSAVTIEIQGYTDSWGKPKLNQNLSEKRAKAVREYMIKQGIEPNRLTAKGYGEAHPRFDNWTQEGRNRNRRIEFKVLSR